MQEISNSIDGKRQKADHEGVWDTQLDSKRAENQGYFVYHSKWKPKADWKVQNALPWEVDTFERNNRWSNRASSRTRSKVRAILGVHGPRRALGTQRH